MIRLTVDFGSATEQVWFNPDHIVLVWPNKDDKGCTITMHGSQDSFTVKETAVEVVLLMRDFREAGVEHR